MVFGRAVKGYRPRLRHRRNCLSRFTGDPHGVGVGGVSLPTHTPSPRLAASTRWSWLHKRLRVAPGCAAPDPWVDVTFAWWQVYVDDFGASIILRDALIHQYIGQRSEYQKRMLKTYDFSEIPWAIEKEVRGVLHTVRMGTELDGSYGCASNEYKKSLQAV